MAGDASRTQVSRDQDSALPRREAGFQEAPGEAEADAVRDAFLKGAGPQPEGIGGALSGADGGARARAVGRLQRERGNAFVQRVVGEMAGSRGQAGRLVGLSQPAMVDEVRRRQGSGSPLPDEARGVMEGFFGAGLGDVRVHTDGEAASLNRELNANAFTVGRDVFFADGAFDPASREGRATLAHELTHVGQQTGFAPLAQREGAPGSEEDETLQALAVQREGSTETEEDEGLD